MAKSEQSSKKIDTVWDLDRNDVPGCVALHETRKARGGNITPSERRVMIKLQDDPKELLQLMTDWE